MPEMTGVECARAIQDLDPNVVIIFATTHDHYMGDAFEVYAFDYLIKPFKVERVIQTLERARERLSAHAGRAAAPVVKPRALSGRMMLKHRDGVTFVDLHDILLIQREERTTVFYTADHERYVTNDTLSEMEERLPSDVFFRCHKSYIINLNHIKDITPYGRWTYVVRLEGTQHDALITHEKYEEMEQMFR
jgi:two-component system LytT family response regulator